MSETGGFRSPVGCRFLQFSDTGVIFGLVRPPEILCLVFCRNSATL